MLTYKFSDQLAETRWKGNGDFYDEDFKVIYSGGNECQRGVAIILDKVTASCVADIQQYNDRVMMIKINAKPVNIIILQIYLPTSDHDDSEIDEIYEHIEDVINSHSKGPDYVIVMGDFNAVVGEKSDGKEVGCYGLGNRK